MLKALRRSSESKNIARQLCADLLNQARTPAFFVSLGVPDSLDGRFDLVVLHAWLVLEQIAPDHRLSQALVNEVFVSFEEALRELGTGDAGINRRLKVLASAFYGRLSAYRMAKNQEDLAEAIWRNVYRGVEDHRMHAEHLAKYAAASRSKLALGQAATGTLKFPPLMAIQA